MAFRVALRKSSQGNAGSVFGLTRLIHGVAIPAPFSNAFQPVMSSPPSMSLPEYDSEGSCRFPGTEFGGGGSMELMAVPKKKVSKHKRGIRNGPKALKPTPVIIRCKSCGRVKLPHFYCCGGRREDPEATN